MFGARKEKKMSQFACCYVCLINLEVSSPSPLEAISLCFKEFLKIFHFSLFFLRKHSSESFKRFQHISCSMSWQSKEMGGARWHWGGCNTRLDELKKHDKASLSLAAWSRLDRLMNGAGARLMKLEFPSTSTLCWEFMGVPLGTFFFLLFFSTQISLICAKCANSSPHNILGWSWQQFYLSSVARLRLSE